MQLKHASYQVRAIMGLLAIQEVILYFWELGIHRVCQEDVGAAVLSNDGHGIKVPLVHVPHLNVGFVVNPTYVESGLLGLVDLRQ